MSLSPLEVRTIANIEQISTILLNQIKPMLDSLNVIYESAAGVKSTLTQANMDATGTYSGLLKSQVDDAAYALDTTIKTALDGVVTQLTQLAARQ